MLVSAVEQSESAIHIHISPPSWASLTAPHPSRSSQSTELRSLCYTAGLYIKVTYWQFTQSKASSASSWLLTGLRKECYLLRSYLAGAWRKLLVVLFLWVGNPVSSKGIQLMCNADAQRTLKGRGVVAQMGREKILCLKVFLSCLKIILFHHLFTTALARFACQCHAGLI